MVRNYKPVRGKSADIVALDETLKCVQNVMSACKAAKQFEISKTSILRRLH